MAPRPSRKKDAKKSAGLDVVRVVSQGFADAQRSQATHARVVKSLSRAYELDNSRFNDSFIDCFNRALIVFAREPAVERIVTFVASFCASNADTFSSFLLSYLIHNTQAINKAVRFRCVQSIAAILAALPENAEIDDDTFGSLLECAEIRSKDRIPRVRSAAAGALCRLQSTGNPEDDVVAARLVEMLKCDSSAAVRKAALLAVAVTESTLPALLSRTRDIKEDVRKAAFQMLATKLSPHDLEVSERLALLKSGLRDRSNSVREACTKDLLLGGWLATGCNGNVFKLVELLGGYTEEDLVLQALSTVFKSEKHQHLLEDIEIDINNLSLSDALVLRAISRMKQADVALDKFIPSALAYAEVLKYYAVDSFASCHLLALGRGLDLSDETGRRALETTLRMDFLKSRKVAHETVPAAIQALKVVSFNSESTVLSLTQLVRDEVLKSDMDAAIEEQSAPDSQLEDLSPEEEEIDAWRQRRALLICKETLLKCRPTQSDLASPNSAYVELVEKTAVVQVLSEVNENRATALECLGLFCLLDKSGVEARAKIRLFMKACNDELSVAVVALKVIIDFMMIFDLNDENSDYDGVSRRLSKTSSRASSKGSSKVIEVVGISEECLALVSEYMMHVEEEMRTIAIEGMAKLLFTRRVVGTRSMLSRLLIAFHNPSTEDDARMQQCLSVFFNAFAMLNTDNRQTLENAMIPTLKVFEEAPGNSPLSTVDIVKVGQFILQLIGMGEKDEMVILESFARIAESLLNLILDNSDDESKDSAVKAYAKLLSTMRFEDEMELNGVLMKLADAAVDYCEDKRTGNFLRKFRQRIGSVPATHVNKKGRLS